MALETINRTSNAVTRTNDRIRSGDQSRKRSVDTLYPSHLGFSFIFWSASIAFYGKVRADC